MMSNTTTALQNLIDEAQRLPSTTQRDVMRFAIAGYLIGSMKHLPGQHDQSTHGRGGSSSNITERSEEGKLRIEGIERGLQTKSIEHAVIMDNEGNEIFKKSGGKSSVEFYGYEVAQMNGAVLTHNHPGISNTLSFSMEDILLASQGNLYEMRVVGRNQKARLRVSDKKWPSSDEILNAYNDYRHSPGVGPFPDQHNFLMSKASSLGMEYKRYDFKK